MAVISATRGRVPVVMKARVGPSRMTAVVEILSLDRRMGGKMRMMVEERARGRR